MICKKCTGCGLQKPSDVFPKHRSRCKDCTNHLQKMWRVGVMKDSDDCECGQQKDKRAKFCHRCATERGRERAVWRPVVVPEAARKWLYAPSR